MPNAPRRCSPGGPTAGVLLLEPAQAKVIVDQAHFVNRTLCCVEGSLESSFAVQRVRLEGLPVPHRLQPTWGASLTVTFVGHKPTREPLRRPFDRQKTRCYDQWVPFLGGKSVRNASSAPKLRSDRSQSVRQP